MLTYNFANIGSDSLYEYLYKCIKKVVSADSKAQSCEELSEVVIASEIFAHTMYRYGYQKRITQKTL